MTAERAYSTWTIVRNRRLHCFSSVPDVANLPAVVLVHGLGVLARYMRPLFDEPSQDFQVFAPELPGFGRSDRSAVALDIPELADSLADWMSAAGLRRAILVGNSMGCQVIVDLAVRYPQTVDAIILVGPTIDRMARTIFAQLWRALRDLIREPCSLWPILARDYLQSGPLRNLQTLRYALRDRVEEKCPRVSAPALVVRGSYDTIATQRWVEELTQSLPAGRALTIPGGTHAANYSVPVKLARVVNDFLRQSNQLSD